jgi:hypothetical protein
MKRPCDFPSGEHALNPTRKRQPTREKLGNAAEDLTNRGGTRSARSPIDQSFLSHKPGSRNSPQLTDAPGMHLARTLRVQELAEDLDPVDNTRPRPREIRVGIDGVDLAKVGCLGTVQKRLGLLHRALEVEATRHEDRDVDRFAHDLLPAESARPVPAGRENRLPSGRLDLVGNPVPGIERRIGPLENQDPRSTAAVNPTANRVHPGP